ncbi:MAG TPA: Druantia anti-phage system protein DruA [Candidatus Brocadiales bacterium]|nr:Druantia anti-phage system protein DruA [Candidatus Brocadiales bacterium]
MQALAKGQIRKEVVKVLRQQGYEVGKSTFSLSDIDRETIREVHSLAKVERINKRKDFIKRKASLIKRSLLAGDKLEVEKINPRLIEVEADSEWEALFRWWNLVWWSLPYEHAYGRQIRYVVWDQYHKAPIGLIGLQSPILSWSVRDEHLGISKKDRDYWVNQSLSAQRLGALPPYNYVLGGKLVAYLMTANVVRNRFKAKYAGIKTLMQKRELPANLLFITTTGAYGKSSVYTRLKFEDEYVAKFIGYSHGSGSFHIPNVLFDNLVGLLESEGYDVRRGYGSGPSRKLRLITQSLRLLGFNNGASHGVQRAVYLFPFVKNLQDVIQNDAKPKWYHRSIKGLTQYWKDRWALPRVRKDQTYKTFVAEKFIEEALNNLDHPEKICRGK